VYHRPLARGGDARDHVGLGPVSGHVEGPGETALSSDASYAGAIDFAV